MAISILGRQTYVNANYNVVLADEDIMLGTRESGFDIYLPSLSGLTKGEGFRMKDDSGQCNAFPVTVHGDGAEEIQGSSTFVMNVDYAQCYFVSAGDKWLVYASYNPQALPTSAGGTGATNTTDASANLNLVQRTPVVAVQDTNIGNMSGSVPTEIDGKTTYVGFRFLAINEANPFNNGPWIITDIGTGTDDGSAERPTDFDSDEDIAAGCQYIVQSGLTYADHTFMLTSDGPFTLGTTALTFSDITSAGGLELTDSHILVGNASNEAQDVAVSGDISINNAGMVTVTTASEQSVKNYITNKTGGDLLPGTPVHLTSNTDGTIGCIKADCDSGVFATHVVGNATIADNGGGYVHKFFTMGSLDTSTAAAVGSKVYLDMPGTYVFDTAPSGSNKMVQEIGSVVAKDATSGIIIFNICPPVKFGGLSIQDDAITAGKISASFSLSYRSEVLSLVTNRLYRGMLTGTAVAGATLSQATSGATATVDVVNGAIPSGWFDVSSVTGTFDTTNLVTGTNPDTSTFTFTPSELLVDAWELSYQAAGFSSFISDTGTVLSLIKGSEGLATNQVRYKSAIGITEGQIETPNADGWSGIGAEYTGSEVVMS